MEQYGSTTTYNMESVLRKNIVDSEYFRDTCMKLAGWEEVVDEIFYSVQDVEPWMSGNARGASTAFCLLYRSVRVPARALETVRQALHNTMSGVVSCRLFTLVPTERQVKDLLNHVDSPYIRAVTSLQPALLLDGSANATCHQQHAAVASGRLPLPALCGQPPQHLGMDPALRQGQRGAPLSAYLCDCTERRWGLDMVPAGGTGDQPQP